MPQNVIVVLSLELFATQFDHICVNMCVDALAYKTYKYKKCYLYATICITYFNQDLKLAFLTKFSYLEEKKMEVNE